MLCGFATRNFSSAIYVLAVCSVAAFVTSVFALGGNCPKTHMQKTQTEVNGTDMLQETG